MKYLLLIFSLSFFAFVISAFGQTIKKGKGIVGSEKFSYYYIEPEVEVRGILILLPGWGEGAKSIFDKTSLPRLLAVKGFITIVPQLHQTLIADDFTIGVINELIFMHSKRYSSSVNYIIGGLSAGGSIALGYTEYILANDTVAGLKGVFAIDPPLNLNRMYNSSQNKIKYNCRSKLIRKEGESTKRYLLRALNGSPEEQPDQYLKYSVFSDSRQDGGNAKLLKSIPIRLYSEPDLDFIRKTYCEELQYDDMNAFDLDKLSNFLVAIGNHRAEYITTKDKGFHSWNILDPEDCAKWILYITGEN